MSVSTTLKATTIFLVCIGCSTLFNLTWAQRGCATNSYHDALQNEGRQVSDQRFEKWIHQIRKEQRLTNARTAEDPIKIPVVVHVIHNGENIGEGVNISDEQILSQMAVLNEDFQRKNPDTTDTPLIFKPLADEFNIEFVLAKTDPTGQPTNGIERVQGAFSTWSQSRNEQLKSTSYWPAEDYLNIWVTNLSGLNLGYAQFPDIDLAGLEGEQTDNRLTDGVVIDYQSFGSTSKGVFPNMRAPYDKGRTTTHEIGHFFGLRHIWGDVGNCEGNDYVDDTPEQNDSYTGCPSHPRNSCSSIDMFQNYMDFTDDDCMNIFTAGQVSRMSYVLENAPRRFSLQNAAGAFPPDEEFYDLELIAIQSPARVLCTQSINPKVNVRNGGTEPIHILDVEIRVDDVLTYSERVLVDSIFSGESMVLTFPSINVTEALHEIEVSISLVDELDINVINNIASNQFVVDDTREEAPVVSRFNTTEEAETGWTVFNPDGLKTWELRNVPPVEEGNRAYFANLHNYEVKGAKDWMVSPVIDFFGFEEASVRFDVAHARFPGFIDSLLVYASDNCGVDYELLASYPSIEMAVTEDTSFWEPGSEDDWLVKTLSLNDFAGLSEVRLAFVSVNDFGNNLLIDNVEFFVNEEEEIIEIEENNIGIYPNPSFDGNVHVAFNLAEKQDVRLRLFDLSGRNVTERRLTGVLNQTYDLTFADQAAGVYLIHIDGTTINTAKRFFLSTR